MSDGEGEFVVVHAHVRQKPDDLGAIVVHIFRFEDGDIADCNSQISLLTK